MFNCANISAGQASTYYKVDDYYHEKGQVPARVFGTAAERLGLAGEFNSNKFNAALRGDYDCAPIASANTPDAKRAGYDCVFSAPKSVSMEALVYGGTDVVAAHEKAVQAAMREVEALTRARVTENKITKAVGCEIAYFEFHHDTSRNIDNAVPDPNLHTHNVILKQVIVRDEHGNEKLYALENQELFKAQKMLDAIYKQHLAANLRELGYDLELTKDGFEISGYSREQTEIFSKRKNEVDANLAENGLSRENSSIKQRDAANLKDRNSKQKFSRSEMRKSWREQMSGFTRPERQKEPAQRVIVPDVSHLNSQQLQQGAENVLARTADFHTRYDNLVHFERHRQKIVPKDSVACMQCPLAAWQLDGKTVKCYCRMLYTFTWETHDPGKITVCDGPAMAKAEADARASK